MVAASKMRKAQNLALAGRPYASLMNRVLVSLQQRTDSKLHPLLQVREVKKELVVVFSTDKGLAGAFNTNLIRQARELLRDLRARGVETELHVSGKKGLSFFRYQGETMRTMVTDIGDRPTAADAERLVTMLMDEFTAGTLDAVYLVYARFNSALSTPPTTLQVLPVQPPAAAADEGARQVDYILEPGADEILGQILPLYVRNSVYRALVETVAGFYGAQRTAMKNATDNAGDMLEALTRTYNRVRQAAITQEIAEIVGGAAALE